MKVVIAIDSFKGSISSLDAGAAIREGIHRVFPEAEVFVRPLADGGEGTVEALARGMNGRIRTVTVTGPLGTPVEAAYGILDDSKTAIIEMSAAAGITLVDEPNRNPLYTTTYGVGELIRDAIVNGCRNFIVGIGGSATNDGGIGMLQALGYDILDKNRHNRKIAQPAHNKFYSRHYNLKPLIIHKRHSPIHAKRQYNLSVLHRYDICHTLYQYQNAGRNTLV